MKDLSLSTPHVEKHPVHLRDLMVPLGYKNFNHLKNRFLTYLTSSGACLDMDYSMSSYYDTYIHRQVETYYLTKEIALGFILSTRPTISLKLTEHLDTSMLFTILETIGSMDLSEVDVRDKFVYAAKDSSGCLKIGISVDPERRVKELSVGNKDELHLVWTQRADLPKHQSETRLHRALAKFHLRSEWFSPDALKCLPMA